MWKIKKQYRKKGWNYKNDGYYFITICTKERRKIFGTVDQLKNRVNLSSIGKIVYKYWIEIPNHFDFVKLDQFMIMPDHVHGIIVIQRGTRRNEAMPRSYHGKHAYYSRISPQPKSIPTIIGSFKSVVTRTCNELELYEHAWHSRFHDRIIRDQRELQNVRRYIKNNPKNWKH